MKNLVPRFAIAEPGYATQKSRATVALAFASAFPWTMTPDGRSQAWTYAALAG